MKKSSNTLKKNLLIGSILCSGILIFLLLKNNPGFQQSEGVSERAREFLANQERTTDSVWQGRNFENTTETQQRQHVETSCFTITMPFAVRNLKSSIQQDTCVVQATLDSPHAFITINSEPTPNVTSLDDYAAVKLRRSQPDVYTAENNSDLTDQNSLIFSTQTEIVYFHLENERVTSVALYDLARIDPELYDLLTQLVKSVGIQ